MTLIKLPRCTCNMKLNVTIKRSVSKLMINSGQVDIHWYCAVLTRVFLLPFWIVDIVEYLIRGINQMVDVSGERQKQFRKQGQIVSLKNWNRIFQKTKLIDLCLWVSKTYFSTEFAQVIYTKSGKLTCTWVFQIKPLTRPDAGKMRSCMKSQALDLFIFSDNLTSPHKHHYSGVFKRENYLCVLLKWFLLLSRHDVSEYKLKVSYKSHAL